MEVRNAHKLTQALLRVLEGQCSGGCTVHLRSDLAAFPGTVAVLHYAPGFDWERQEGWQGMFQVDWTVVLDLPEDQLAEVLGRKVEELHRRQA